MAVEHQPEVIARDLSVGPLTWSVALAAGEHVVLRRQRRVERGLIRDAPRAADCDALLHQARRPLRDLGRDVVERAALVVAPPAPPVRQRAHPAQQLVLRSLGADHPARVRRPAAQFRCCRSKTPTCSPAVTVSVSPSAEPSYATRRSSAPSLVTSASSTR